MEKQHISKNTSKRKAIIISICIALLIITSIILIKNVYKNKNIGHNMSNQPIEEIEKYILNISSYNAKVEVTVESNKNTNKYIIEQTYQKDKISKQKIIQPSNIEGIEIKYENGKLTLYNSKLNLEAIYDNYSHLVENCLWLDSFIQDYIEAKNNNEASITIENNLITMETKTRNSNNRYIYYKTLTIDKTTGKPTKLLIQDINKNNLVYILYNEITVNGSQ